MPTTLPPQLLTGACPGKELLFAGLGLLNRGLLNVLGVAALDAANEEAVKIVSQQNIAFAFGAGLE